MEVKVDYIHRPFTRLVSVIDSVRSSPPTDFSARPSYRSHPTNLATVSRRSRPWSLIKLSVALEFKRLIRQFAIALTDGRETTASGIGVIERAIVSIKRPRDRVRARRWQMARLPIYHGQCSVESATYPFLIRVGGPWLSVIGSALIP